MQILQFHYWNYSEKKVPKQHPYPAEKVHESSWKFMKYDEKMPQ